MLAVNVLNMIEAKDGKKYGHSISDRVRLYGCDIDDMDAFVSGMKIKNKDFNQSSVEYIAKNYGTEGDDVLKLATLEKELSKNINTDSGILAEVVYAIRNETAKTLSDIIFRRTGIGTLGNPGDDVLKLVADCAAKELGWGAERKKEELNAVVKMFAC